MPRGVVFKIKDIVEIANRRVKNNFDFNIAVTGARGNGKSTCIGKIFWKLNNFKPKKHIVYSREDVIKLLSSQKYGLCWDDEAINSGYKREFFSKAQQDLIKYITAYRDNFNIFASAVPNFFSLDKDLRDLFFMHIFIKERGIAHVHMPLQGRIYSQDKWDAITNAKIEASWTKRMRMNPNFKPPYHKLTTFKGYLIFNDLTAKQKEIYTQIKFEKRKIAYENLEEKPKEKSFLQKMFDAVIEKKITKNFLIQSCIVEGKKFSSVQSKLNQMLRDAGKGTLSDHLGLATKRNILEREGENKSILPLLNEGKDDEI